MRKILRGTASCALFLLFGVGALLLTPVMWILRNPEHGQPWVRFAWKFMVCLFVRLHLIRITFAAKPSPKGSILVANHPSLIDVVLLTVSFPKTVYVAKSSLRHDFFLAAIVRATAVVNDADLIDRASSLLAKGWNILIFPEGTRSPIVGTDPLFVGTDPKITSVSRGKGAEMWKFDRGAAQLALRTGAKLLPIGIVTSRRILAKGQAPWDMGTDPVEYRFRVGEPIEAAIQEGESRHRAAIRVTAELERCVQRLVDVGD